MLSLTLQHKDEALENHLCGLFLFNPKQDMKMQQ